jgi:hypothetical protein
MRAILACLAISCLAAGPVAAADERWFHVVVDGGGRHEERVRVNLPFSLVERVLPRIETKELRREEVSIGGSRLSREDVEAILAAARTAADGEPLAADRLDEDVRVSKEGEYLRVRANEDDDVADARVPLSVLDALYGRKGELDLLAAVRALEKHADGVAVTLEESGSTVRIWIDRRNESD